MRNELLEQMLRSIYPTVTQDGDGEGDGGGGGSAGDDGDGDDDEALGEGGKKALTKLREELKAANRRLKQVEGLDPKVYKEATAKADQLERELRERESLTAADRLRMELKANERVNAAQEEAKTERIKRIELETETLAKAAFDLAKGRPGADKNGLTYFKAFMSTVGRQHLKVDEQGNLYVVDAQGDPVQSPDGKGRIAPDAWMKTMADQSEVVGSFFQPAMGSGSGMGNSRGQGGRNLPALKDLTPGERRDLAWNSSN